MYFHRRGNFFPGKQLKNNTLDKEESGKINAEIREAIEQLTQEERTLIVLREELYDGSWEAMEADLQDRLEGRPYIFKLNNRIEDDLARIEQLQELEDEQAIDLSNYIDLSEE